MKIPLFWKAVKFYIIADNTEHICELSSINEIDLLTTDLGLFMMICAWLFLQTVILCISFCRSIDVSDLFCLT